MRLAADDDAAAAVAAAADDDDGDDAAAAAAADGDGVDGGADYNWRDLCRCRCSQCCRLAGRRRGVLPGRG